MAKKKEVKDTASLESAKLEAEQAKEKAKAKE